MCDSGVSQRTLDALRRAGIELDTSGIRRRSAASTLSRQQRQKNFERSRLRIRVKNFIGIIKTKFASSLAAPVFVADIRPLPICSRPPPHAYPSRPSHPLCPFTRPSLPPPVLCSAHTKSPSEGCERSLLRHPLRTTIAQSEVQSHSQKYSRAVIAVASGQCGQKYSQTVRSTVCTLFAVRTSMYKTRTRTHVLAIVII